MIYELNFDLIYNNGSTFNILILLFFRKWCEFYQIF